MTSNDEATTYENHTVSPAQVSTRKSATSGSEKYLICCVHGSKCKYGRQEERKKLKSERQDREQKSERQDVQRKNEDEECSFDAVEYYLGALSRKEVCF